MSGKRPSNIQWDNTIGTDRYDHVFSAQQTIDGGYVIGGISTGGISGDKTEANKGMDGDFWIVKLYGDAKYITGNIFADLNNDCIQNNNETGLQQYSLKAYNNQHTVFAASQASGIYYLPMPDTGTYSVQLIPNNAFAYYNPSTCNENSIHLTTDIDTLNLALKSIFQCQLNNVHISTSSLFRIGRESTFYVSYCNNGTVPSPNTYITIKLDSLMDFNNASIPSTLLADNTYRFDIGNINSLHCDTFSFSATPKIGAVILGQTLCAEAHIYPDTICTTPNYFGAYTVVSQQCLDDSVRFQIQNIGNGNMTAPKKYIVIEGNVMRINREYQLDANEILTETLLANEGQTYRIIAEEPNEVPPSYGDSYATAAVENCQPVSNFPTGYFMQFSNYDGEPYREISCNAIIGSYDPNDKTASPVGYDAPHYIEANTTINYQINFQNTGNDTAFKVAITDTIASTLNINSLQPGASSHAYKFQRIDSNVVRFVFDDINLVDSFKNEKLSHGFAKFSIQQKTDNAIGTKIYNSAAIYFDYNAPIITNQTYHTVGKDFMRISLLNTILNPAFNVKEVNVFPNPFHDKTQVIIKSDALKDPALLLMNIEGKIIKTILPSSQNIFDIYRQDLATGFFLFKIVENGQTVANGKLLIQ